jgi:hypothetical protein
MVRSLSVLSSGCDRIFNCVIPKFRCLPIPKGYLEEEMKDVVIDILGKCNLSYFSTV